MNDRIRSLLGLSRIATTRWAASLGCQHKNQRCIHGDEIIQVGFKRARCLDCGQYLTKLPETYYYTGERHGRPIVETNYPGF